MAKLRCTRKILYGITLITSYLINQRASPEVDVSQRSLTSSCSDGDDDHDCSRARRFIDSYHMARTRSHSSFTKYYFKNNTHTLGIALQTDKESLGQSTHLPQNFLCARSLTVGRNFKTIRSRDPIGYFLFVLCKKC